MGTQAAGCWRFRKLRESQERTKIQEAGTPALVMCQPGHLLPSSGNATFLGGQHSLMKNSQASKREEGDP